MTYAPTDEPAGSAAPTGLALHANFGAGSPMTFDEMQRRAKMFLASGLFSTKGGPIEAQIAQLAVKIMAGQELGVPAYAAARGIDIINGQVAPDAGLTAALVKGSGRYRYHVAQWDAQSCLIHWYELVSGEWLALGSSSFTMDEAKQAGLMRNAAWTNYPKAMLWARAMTQGARAYCPDIFIGTVYTREELGGQPDTGDVPPPPTNTVMPHEDGTVMAGEVIEHEPVPPPGDEPAAKPEHWTALIDAATTDAECDEINERLISQEDNKFRRDAALKRLSSRRAALRAAGAAPMGTVDPNTVPPKNEAPGASQAAPGEPTSFGNGWRHPDTGEIHPEKPAPRLDFWVQTLEQTETHADCVAALEAAKGELAGHPAQWRYLFGKYNDHMKALGPQKKAPKPKKAAPEQTYQKRGEM